MVVWLCGCGPDVVPAVAGLVAAQGEDGRGAGNKEKLVQASGSRMRHRATPGRSSGQPRRRPHEITHPRIQAKKRLLSHSAFCSVLFG